MKLLLGLLLPLALLAPGQAARANTFTVTTHPYTFGQAPVFMPDGRVVHAKDYGDGAGQQVYLSALDGSNKSCVTCTSGAPAAPNGVPAVRPQGDWILFHSW